MGLACGTGIWPTLRRYPSVALVRYYPGGSQPHGRWRMSTVGFIKRGLDFAHRALADACNGTPEQLHFVPENGSHSIAWCLWHTARVEDIIINGRARQSAQIWDESWANRTGLPFEGMGTGMSDEDALQVRIEDIDALRAYQQ